MEPILQLLQSYSNLRLAVLRSLNNKKLSKSEFTKVTGLHGDTKYRRQTNPGLWKPAEIHRLAVELGLKDSTETNRLQNLGFLIASLSELDKKVIGKASLLTAEKLRYRLQHLDAWQPQELEKLQRFLEASQLRKR